MASVDLTPWAPGKLTVDKRGRNLVPRRAQTMAEYAVEETAHFYIIRAKLHSRRHARGGR